tara:strand:+ start:613 stop:894 length:282 start_codon:yes stop_codon:yes gene_type:complete
LENKLERKTKSILEELSKISVDRDRNFVTENRAEHLIKSAINLLEQIDQHYSTEQAKDLNNRFINSIRGRDHKKFSRGIKKIIKEAQREDNAD